MVMRKIHIFKAGEQISSTGLKKVFTEEDLQSMVESFNPNSHEPPIRVGHEDNDKVPSFGWVKNLERQGGNLYAYVEFTPEMEELIQKGHYRKVSASFYSPASEVNPSKGKYTLKHVAMLGGTPPAVKGLEPFGFSEAEGEMHSEELEIEFTEIKEEPEMVTEAKKPSTEEVEVKEEFKEKKPVKVEIEVEEEEEEEEMPEEDEDMEMSEVASLQTRLREMEVKFLELSYKEKESEDLQTRLAEMEAKFAEMEAAKAEAEALLMKEKRDRRREVLSQRVEALYSEGKLTEGLYPQDELLEFAVGLEEGTLEFSEGETAADTLIAILSSIPAPVEFGEFAPESEAVVPESSEEEEVDFAEKVEKYAEEKGITYEQALRILYSE